MLTVVMVEHVLAAQLKLIRKKPVNDVIQKLVARMVFITVDNGKHYKLMFECCSPLLT